MEDIGRNYGIIALIVASICSLGWAVSYFAEKDPSEIETEDIGVLLGGFVICALMGLMWIASVPILAMGVTGYIIGGILRRGKNKTD